MDPILAGMIRLQELCVGIVALQKQLAAIPGRKQELEQSLAHHRAAVAKAKDELADLQKSHRQMEGELGLVETKINKYQEQLMAVKTNREYSAMQTEIENVKKEGSALETKILQAMESGDLLDQAIKEKEQTLKAEEQRVAAGLAVIAEEEKELREQESKKESEKKQVEASLEPGLVADFAKIAEARGGVAVCRVAAGLCEGCSVRVRPSVFQQMRRDGGLHRCENCRRYLYYLEEKSAESPSTP